MVACRFSFPLPTSTLSCLSWFPDRLADNRNTTLLGERNCLLGSHRFLYIVGMWVVLCIFLGVLSTHCKSLTEWSVVFSVLTFFYALVLCHARLLTPSQTATFTPCHLLTFFFAWCLPFITATTKIQLCEEVISLKRR